MTESLPLNDAAGGASLPRYRLDVEAGVPVLRDGWTAVFYLPAPCEQHQAAAARCIAEYLRLVRQPALRWTIDEEGEAVELDDAAIGARLTALAQPGEESVGFRLMDNPEGVSAHRVRYIGLHADDPIAAMRPDAVGLLLLTYATETVERLGMDLLTRFHDAVATALPISSGYLSPAFIAATGAGEPAAFEKIRGLCRRYRCLDVSHVSIDTLTLGNRLRGAYWLNYLGAAHVQALGGQDAIGKALSAQPVLRRPLAGDVLALQMAGAPISGDVNRREDVGAYAALAEVFEPRLYEAAMAFPEFELEDTAHWFRRFLESDTA
ncbi:type VI immunity family protein [Roseateles noduli]|uniref:type VI immunity family protein n=1 Tax=Roseateles noduli TaxID=2052484 RepID=UPI003D656F06